MIKNGMNGGGDFGDDHESDRGRNQVHLDLGLVLKELQPRIKSIRRKPRLKILEDTRTTVLKNWDEYRKRHAEYSVDALRYFATQVFEYHELVFIEKCKMFLSILERLISHSPWPSADDIYAIQSTVSEDFVERVLQIMEHDSETTRRAVELMLRGMNQSQVTVRCNISVKEARNIIIAFWERVENELHELVRIVQRDTQLDLRHSGHSAKESKALARKLVLCSYEEQQALFSKMDSFIHHYLEDAEDQTYVRRALGSIKEILLSHAFSENDVARLLGHINQVCPALIQLIRNETG